MTDTEILDFLEKHMSLLYYTPLTPSAMRPYYSLSVRKGQGKKWYGCDFAPTIREAVSESAALLREQEK